ncbi:MAG TPA: hypothetical protein VIH42_04945, partial [Thermoguttaceae bacterium]
LDREPDGWRRCAMAFLEAQSWKKEIGDLRQSVTAVSLSTKPVVLKTKQINPHFKLLGTLASMAACFLLTLWIGVWWQQHGRHAAAIIAGGNSNQLVSKTSEQAATILPMRSDQTSTPWQLVRLSPAGSTDSSQALQLPAIERDQIDEQWLKSMPDSIPNNVVQALRHAGYRVRTNQELLPLQFKDGRRLVVPIDQVDVKYVGNKVY